MVRPVEDFGGNVWRALPGGSADEVAAAISAKHVRHGVLDVDAAADEVYTLAQKDPRAAADVLEELGGRIDAQDRQRLSQAVAERVDANGGKSPANPGDAASQRNQLMLDLTQMALDVAGLVDPTPVSDGLNGLISLFRGDLTGAGLSAVSMIPYIGDAAKLGKLGKWAQTVSNAVELAAKSPDFAKMASPVLKRISDAIDAIPKGVMDKLPASARETLQGIRTKIDELLTGATKFYTPQVGKADLDAFRNRIGVPSTDTLGVAKTDIPQLSGKTFEGASPAVRKEAGLPPATPGPIASPSRNALLKNHAEEDIANQFVAEVKKANLKPSDLDGRTLSIHVSKEVCSTCKAGLANPDASSGVLKQLSEMYPGLTIRVTAEGVANPIVLQGGRRL